VSLLSVPRDTQIELPDVGVSKLNAAYGQGYARAEELYGPGTTPQQGGMALAATTLGDVLNQGGNRLRIHYIAQVNFDGFAQIIDALGGVTIDVPKQIIDDEYPTDDFRTMHVEFQPGPQHMDGARALIYARTRHADSDFDRGARQQQVIRAVITELRQRGAFGQALVLPKLLSGLHGTVATTLPIDRPDVLLGLAWIGSGLNPDEIGQVRLGPDIDPNMQEVGSNLIWSQAGLEAAVSSLITRPDEASEAASVQVLNGSGVSGLARRVTGDLERDGFGVIPAGDAPTADVAKTVIYDLKGKPRTSHHLASVLHAEVRSDPPDGLDSPADIVVVLGKDAATQ
jgi:LCP family protein required for cell wall assembly